VSSRMLLAEGHPLILAGVEYALAGLPEFQVVGRTTRRSDVVQLVEEHEPDVLLLDLALAAPNVRRLIEQVHASDPALCVVAFARDRSRVDDALRSGASGFVYKRTPPEELASVLIRAMNGTQLDDLLLDALGVPRVILTEREADIAYRVAARETNREVAGALHLSATTVKFHLTNIHRKLGTTSREELIRAVEEAGYGFGLEGRRSGRADGRG
jgi:DNA-binding NarL/FixJ family response regulator